MNELTAAEEQNVFDYSKMDSETATFLQASAFKLREIEGRAYTEAGRVLKEAQEHLSLNGYGEFEEWYGSLGYKRQTVYRLLDRYKLILSNWEEQNLIEDLPISLSYEIAKPSIIPELKAAALNGEIKTLKEFKDMEKALKDKENEVEQLEADNFKAEQELLEYRIKEIALAEKPEVQIIKEAVTVEVIPADYEQTKQALARMLQSHQKVSNENTKLQKESRELKLENTSLKGIDSDGGYSKKAIGAAVSFKVEVWAFIERVGGLAWVVEEIDKLPASEKKDFTRAFERLKELIGAVEYKLQNNKSLED